MAQKFLVDTNIWVDYFLRRGSSYQSIVEFLSAMNASDSAVLYTASLTVKDVAYVLAQQMKAEVRAKGKKVTPDVAVAANEVSWGCVRTIREFGLITSVGQTEIWNAFLFKHLHSDLEDDILLGAGEAIDADYIVTHDKLLQKHAPGICISATEALERLER